MTDEEQRVAGLVREAFRDVVLGDGVGLMQGQALDDYKDESTVANYRARDEQHDWSAVSISELQSCNSSLSFFDPEGMRFHLPAYLVADLEGTLTHLVMFHLCYTDPGPMDRFSALTNSQFHAVREFLLLRLSDPDYEFERPMMQNALNTYWVERESS